MDFGVTGFVGGIWRDDVVETNGLESGYERKRQCYESSIESLLEACIEGKTEIGGTGICNGVERNGSIILKDFTQGISVYRAARIM